MSFRRLRRRGTGATDYPRREPYQTYRYHSEPGAPRLEAAPGGVEVRVAAIDPAVKNCAFRVERRVYPAASGGNVFAGAPLSVGTELQVRYNFLLTVAEADAAAAATAARRAAGRKRRAPAEAPEPSAPDDYHVHLYDYLARHVDLLARCQYILIESQMVINQPAMRVAQAIITFLLVSLKDRGVRPVVVEIDPRAKYRLLGAPAATKPKLKQWAAAKGDEILRAHGDAATADAIAADTKRDDHGDVVCFTTAWFLVLRGGGFFCPVMPEGATGGAE